MMICPAVLLKITFITAGSDHRLILYGKHPKILICILWVLHCHAPAASILLCSKCLHISTKIDQSALDPAGTKNIHDTCRSITFRDSSKVDLHSVLFKNDLRCLFIIRNIRCICQREQILKFVCVRHPEIVICKSPYFHNRINRNIKCTICSFIQIQ